MDISSRAPRSALNLLDRMVENRTLSADGRNWLIQNLDPFHDRAFPPVGDPDVATSRSVTHCVQLVQDIVAPSSASGGAYDCDIFFLPASPNIGLAPNGGGSPQFEYVMGVRSIDGFMGTTFGSNTTRLTGTMNVLTMPAGVDWKADTASLVDNVTEVSLPNDNCFEQWRLVGCAYEVVNTTPELTRGGSVTMYRSPSNFSPGYTVFTTTVATSTVTAPVRQSSLKDVKMAPLLGKTTEFAPKRQELIPPRDLLPFPTALLTYPGPTGILGPSTLAEMGVYPGTITESAIDGVYQVITRSDVNNPPINPSPSLLVWQDPFSEADLIAPYACWLLDGLNSTQPSAHPLPYDICGCKFTGLSNTSTLTLTVRYFLEKFPTATDTVLTSLSRPSPCYDPVALEIYSRCMDALPVGCGQKDNPFGEWFRGVVSEVAKWAAPIGKALGGIVPGAQAIGSIVGGAAKAIQKVLPEEEKQPKKSKKTSPKPPTNPAPPLPGTSKSAKRRARRSQTEFRLTNKQ